MPVDGEAVGVATGVDPPMVEVETMLERKPKGSLLWAVGSIRAAPWAPRQEMNKYVIVENKTNIEKYENIRTWYYTTMTLVS